MLRWLNQVLAFVFGRGTAVRRPVVEEVEPRILYSADVNPLLWAGQDPNATAIVAAVDTGSTDTTMQTVDAQQEQARRREIVFVDAAVPDAQLLIDDILAQRSDAADIEVVQLRSDVSGLQQISETLANEQDLDVIHIVSHGESGRLWLGNGLVNSDGLRAHDGFGAWKAALNGEANVLLWGCNVADGDAGEAFIRQFAALTGADVAASTDNTGSTEGSNWSLEFATGGLIPSNTLADGGWQGVLATYTVTNTNDSGAGSLRQAIIDANAGAGADIITFNISGTGTHSITPLTALPTITGAVTIDATTDDSFGANLNRPAIIIDGNNGAFEAFVLSSTADGSVIRGFVLRDFNGDAIEIQAGSDGNTITGNYIGSLNEFGSSAGVAEANSLSGLYVLGSNNTISGNVLSGNTYSGVEFDGTASGNAVIGNFIGTDAAGTAAIGNTRAGVYINGTASNNVIGGVTAGSGNLIANNAWDGIRLNGTGMVGNAFLGNTIYGNTEQAIDIGAQGVTANDAGDADTGGNNLQNFPVLTSANSNAAGTTIAGTLNSNASTTYRVEFFANRPTVADAPNGEGERYLGFITVTTDGSGNATIGTTLASVWVNSGDRITATATVQTAGPLYGSTSEFAANVTATSTGIVVVDTTSDAADGTTTSITSLGNARGADGRISLREAIIAANNTANGGTPDRIVFNIAGAGVHTISLSSLLPSITTAVEIDASTDDSFGANGSRPAVVLSGDTNSDGSGDIANGLTISGASANGSTVRGLIFQRFTSEGLAIAGSDGNTVAGNWFGLTSAGSAAAGNGAGIGLWNASNNVIGGSTAADRNVVSGSTNVGIAINTNNGTSSGNQIQGNYIGTDATGAAAIGNANQGIWVNAAGNTIGGTSAGQGNVISGSVNWVGVQLETAASGTLIAGNLIGLNAAGTAALGNAGGGVYIVSANNTVGGTTAAARNVISGNGGAGLMLMGATATGNVVVGNYIGTDAAGTGDVNGSAAVGGASGVVMDLGATNNRIGTDADGSNDAAERNVISGNNWYGIEFLGSGTSGNVAQGNYVGVDATGLVALGNSQGGVSFWNGASNNRLGGGATGAGNVISANGTGVLVANGVTGNKIQGNLIGLGADGTTALGNTGAGVYFFNGGSASLVSGNVIGTDADGSNDAGERNVISANYRGVAMLDAEVTGNFVAGNYIGTDATGLLDRGNTLHGVYLLDGAHANTIGGSLASQRNIISGNDGGGIEVNGEASDGNVLRGNWIGVAANGTSALGNIGHGIHVLGGGDNTLVGGTGANDGNWIASATLGGVFVKGDSLGTVIQGNRIGTDLAGTANWGTGQISILLENGASQTLVGGTMAGAGNIVANAGQGGLFTTGIAVIGANSTDNVFLRNSIYNSVGLGIDLGNDGVSANDAGDADSGANGLLNALTIDSATTNGSTLYVAGGYSGAPNTYYRIDVYSNTSAEPSGTGEGGTWVGTVNMSVGASGTLSGSYDFSAAVAVGSYISATVTRTDSSYTTFYETSEFSNHVVATAPNVAPAGSNGTISAVEDTVYTFTTANFGFSDGDGDSLTQVWFDTLPASGTLRWSGTPFAAGNWVDASDITAGLLTYTPAPDANGTAAASFTFRVQDDGGTLGGGADTDASPNTITIDIAAVNDASVITSNGGGSTAAVSVVENSSAVTTVTSTDIDGGAAAYSIVGGADAALFSINAGSGVLMFNASPDFESPADVGGNNVYDVTVQVSDGNGGTDTQAIAVTVTNANGVVVASPDASAGNEDTAITGNVLTNDAYVEPGVLTAVPVSNPANGSLSLNPDGSFTYTPNANFNGSDSFEYLAVDPNAGLSHYWGLEGNGADAVGGSSGVVAGSPAVIAGDAGSALQFDGVDDHVALPDVTYGNEFSLTFQFKVSDNSGSGLQYFYSHGTLPTAALPNTLQVALVENAYAIPAQQNSIVTTVWDGNDSSGQLFVDIASLIGDGQWHQYTLTVRAGVGIEVYVDGVSRGTLATGGEAINPTGNAQIGARSDLDPSRFLNGGGAMDSVALYNRALSAAEVSALNTSSQQATVTLAVAPLNDAPVLDSSGTMTLTTITEDTTGNAGQTVASIIASAGGDRITDVDAGAVEGIAIVATSNGNGSWEYSTNGGANWSAVGAVSNTSALLLRDTDLLRFAPDAQNATTGDISFRAWDQTSGSTGSKVDASVNGATTAFSTATETASITVSAVNDAPVITSNGGGAMAAVNVAENQTAITTVASSDVDGGTAVYSIAGGADAARFSINASTGVLTFNAAPNHEAPADAGGNNVYDVTVQVSDGAGGSDTQVIAVTVTPVNDNAPVITSNGGGATAAVNVAENQTVVATVFAADADLPAQSITYSIAGGADAALFTIDAGTGALSFVGTPDFEVPADAGANNVYDVIVQASDGVGGTDTQAMAVTVTAVNEAAPVITSNGGGATAAVSVAETSSAVTTVTATDADLPAPTFSYSIAGGADAARFSIDAVTGVLTFAVAPDFEAPTDAGADNVYDVTVQVSDGSGGFDTQAISVTVTDVTAALVVSTEQDNADSGIVSGNAAHTAEWLNANKGADGQISLREAIIAANNTAGLDTITFAIAGGGTHVISLASSLPTITDAVVLDATTQAGYAAGVPVISIDGTSAGADANAFVLHSSGSTLRGFEIRNFTQGSSATTGVAILIDGTTGGGDSNTITANVLTLNSNPVGGGVGAISIVGAADNNLIDGNALLNNDADGIRFADTLSTGNQITNNLIDGQGDDGVKLAGSNITFSGNTVSNSQRLTPTASGIEISGLTGGVIANNIVINAGTEGGIWVLGSSGLTLSGNTVTSGLGSGIAIDAGSSNVHLAGNLVWGNAGLGIDLGPDGVTANDAGDGDAGANGLQNFPVLASAAASGGDTTIVGSLNSAANTTYRIEFFSAPTADASGYGEGQTYLGFVEVTTDAGGDAAFSALLSGVTVAEGHAVSATATAKFGPSSYGGTSEFSACITANRTPVITSNGGGASASVSVAEGATAVTTVNATDADTPAQTLTYAIVGGADAARFSIDPSTGVLTFNAASDFEAPVDAGSDNVYDVVVRVSDSLGGSDTQAIAVTVTNVNEAPVITSNGSGATAAVSAAENQTAVTTVASSDVDGGAPVYSIAGGADAARFAIDATTGALTFVVAPNFEAPTDAGADNVYDVTVQVADGSGGIDTQAIAVTVTNVNEAPVITSAATASAAENQTAVATVTSSDVDGGAPVYTIVGGADAARFTIDAATGVLAFVAAPNFEAPADAGADNVYDVTVQVADGNGGAGTQAIAVTVSNVNEAPIITSAATASVAENQTAAITVTSSDVDGGAPVYSIVGGADAARFAIDAVTGVLTFIVAPNFETPTDASGDNVYDVTVQVSDGNGGADMQAIAITVANVNEAPAITSGGSVSAAENQTAVTTVTSSDVDGGAPVYSIAGGADAARFAIDVTTGVLTFVVAPDFESPTDAGANNVYDVTVQVADGNGGMDTQAIAVTVTNINEAPIITSAAAVNAAENQTTAITVTSSDVDGGTPGYSIVGGADAARFVIDSATGVLSFAIAPDFEAPTDAGADNVYDVTVQVADGNGGSDTQAIAVNVTNVNEAPIITSGTSVSAAENQTAVTTVASSDIDGGAPIYSITGGADAAHFAIDATTGVLTFNSAPDFEAPADVGGDNVYDVTVQVADGNGGFGTQSVAVTVTNVNEAPVITSNGGGVSANISAAENQTAVTTLTSTDLDGGAPIYSIVGGADGALFTIDSATGAISFVAAPDFELPADAGGDGIYNLTVQVADGNGGFDTQALAVTVTNVNEAPVITSNGGGANAAVDADENQSAGGTVTATDEDADTPIYSIVGGADAALFSIDSTSGVLFFNSAPDFEAPTDADGDNVYELTVQVADGNGGFDTQQISVTVRNVNEAPVITSSGSVTIDENQTSVMTVASTDVDGGAALYSIAGGADAARFAIDAAAGTLSFRSAPDFEAPSDADLDNVYELMVSVDDGYGGTDMQSIAVAVTGINEAPGNIAPAAAELIENAPAGTVVAIVTASDPDAGDLFTFTLVTDGAGRFVVDPASGRLQVAPGAVFDFQTEPSHALVLRVTDTQGLRTEQTIVVTLREVAEVPPDMVPPDMTPPPAPSPAPAPAPAPSVPTITPVVSSTLEEIVRGDGREPSESVTRGLFDLTTDSEAARNARWQPQRGRSADGDAPMLVASVSFGFDGGAFGGWSEDALNGLLQPQNEGSAPRFGLFSLRGSLIETDDSDGSSRPAARDADEALLAALQDPVRVASATLTAGFVWWLTRSGGLLTSILMGIPAWRHVDLLPVLAPAREDEDDDGLGADSQDDDAEPDRRDSLVDDLFSNTSRMFGESRFVT